MFAHLHKLRTFITKCPVIIITGFKAPERDWPVTTITGTMLPYPLAC